MGEENANGPDSLVWVLLPGLDGTGRLFDELVKPLPQSKRVLVVSYPDDPILDYAALEQFVRGRLPASDSFLIVAESFSGPIGVRIAADPPPNLKALVLCTTFLRNPLPLIGTWAFRGLGPMILLGRSWSWALRAFLVGWGAPGSLLRAVAETIRFVPVATLNARGRLICGCDVSSSFTRIDLPILYLRAKADRLIPTWCAEEVAQLNGRAKVAEIPGPHLLLQRCPGQCVELIREFEGLGS